MSTGGTVLKVNGMVSVQIRVVGNTVRIPGPHGAGIVVCRQTEAVGVFAEAVDVRVRREGSLYADVLRLEDYGVILCREENFV